MAVEIRLLNIMVFLECSYIHVNVVLQLLWRRPNTKFNLNSFRSYEDET
jgi:hypothetical protein